MIKKLSCEQIDALIGFYAEGTLHSALQNCVKEHISNCTECKKKLLKLSEIIKNNNQSDNNSYETKQYADFKRNLSAYIDNELDDLENIKIKKFVISNSAARQELEDIISFKNLLHNSFEKTKNSFKGDYSKSITTKIQQELNMHNPVSFYKLAALFIFMFGLIIVGLITILHF